MSKKRSNKISTIGSQISTIISVSLVLLIVGMILTISTLTGGASDALKQRVAMVVSLAKDIPTEKVQLLQHRLEKEPYTASLTYTSADEVLRQEMEYNEDILNTLGENPYSAEFEIFLRPQYVNADSIIKISQSLDYLEEVEEVYSQSELIENVNHILKRGTLVLTIIGVILLSISVVLLFNTISLVIYSRRFIIRTMQLVGATSAFIRRPFVKAGALMGVLSALIASALLCGMHLYSIEAQVDNLFFVSWTQTLIVCGVLFVVGILLCSLAAAMATNRFLHASHEALYRK